MALSVLFVHALVDALERSGVPRERFLDGAPVDRAALESLEQRVELATYDALLERALTLTGDESFGLRAADLVGPASYNLTAHLAAHATTMRDAIGALLRFYQLLTDQPFWRLVEEGRTASLVYDGRPGPLPVQRFRAELTISSLYKLFKNFVPRGRPRAVAFDYPAPPYRGAYTRVFEGTETFDQAFTGVVFDRGLLETAQIHKDPELHATIVSRAERKVSAMVKDAGYAERVRRYILDGAGPERRDMEAVARALGVSGRSLRRRLAEEGKSFREVVDEALGTLAKRLVAEDEGSIEAAAYAMGFAHPSAFHRAFKRGTGATPAAIRPRGAKSPRAPR
jgi:AraC-like DNA-binding protein